MKNIEDINRESVKKILSSKKIADFSPGDTIKVGVKIIEGKRERIQYFEGVCIAKKSRDLNSSFPERITFIESITVPNNGNVLSTPSPKEIFLTVNDELMFLFFFAIQTPSKF